LSPKAVSDYAGVDDPAQFIEAFVEGASADLIRHARCINRRHGVIAMSRSKFAEDHRRWLRCTASEQEKNEIAKGADGKPYQQMISPN
jgi:hypothetical protein